MSKTKQAAPSASSAPKRNRTRRKPTQAQTRRMTPSITAPEALQLLESAVSYCQAAGLQVNAANNEDGTLALFIPRAQYIVTGDGTRAAFRLAEQRATYCEGAQP